jgi:hypothetical protein
MEALKALRAARESEGVAATQTASAESDLTSISGEIGQLKARIAEREMELAESGGPLPADAFPEEADVLRADRQRRVVAARVELCRDRLRESQQNVETRKAGLAAAWHDFCREEYSRAIDLYREAALGLRSQYAALNAWRSFFPRGSTADFPNPGYLIIEDPLGRQILDRWLVHCEMFGEATWKPLAGDLYAALCEVQSQVERAQAGEPARILESEDGEER